MSKTFLLGRLNFLVFLCVKGKVLRFCRKTNDITQMLYI